MTAHPASKSKMQIKVYLIMQRHNLVKPGDANVTVIATRLTRLAAQEIVDVTPGTYIEKHIAYK